VRPACPTRRPRGSRRAAEAKLLRAIFRRRAAAPGWRRLARPPASEFWHDCLRVVRHPWPALAPDAGRIVFFSDLHHWRARPERLALLETAIAAESPDWLLFGGDLCRHLTDLDDALAGLARMRARRGAFAIPGNRERAHLWLPHEFWAGRFARAGFRLLNNETADLGPLVLAGLDDQRHGTPFPALLDGLRDSPKPVLSLWHSPDGPAGAAGHFLGHLVLAGHTHGGQFRFPLIGPVYTSSAYGRQFDQGWFERADGTRLYVTAGCGETGTPRLRRRLLCPPEILVLHPGEVPS